MARYIVTLTYSWMNGKDFTVSLFAFGNDEKEAIEYAKKQLRERVGNCAITHSIAFIEMTAI